MTEEQEQMQLIRWVKAQYPNLLFTADLGGVRVHRGIRNKVKAMRCKKGHPDLMFQKAKRGNSGIMYCGLAIEFKRTGEVIQKKDGTLRKNTHLKEQHDYLLELQEEGWFACFAVGVLEAKEIIQTYLNNDWDIVMDFGEHVFPKQRY